MIATVINVILIFIGSMLGLLFKNKINQKFSDALVTGIALCVIVIGISSAIKTENMILVIISMLIGIALGEAIDIEGKLNSFGDNINAKFKNGNGTSRFTECFVTSTLLFCVGSMAITGSMEAGINKDYTIILSKSINDGITSITFAATMGLGVLLSSVSVFVYQGAITLIAMFAGNFMSPEMINEMSAVGGVINIALALNMLEIKKLRVGNMIPAIFIPAIYYGLLSLI